MTGRELLVRHAEFGPPPVTGRARPPPRSAARRRRRQSPRCTPTYPKLPQPWTASPPGRRHGSRSRSAPRPRPVSRSAPAQPPRPSYAPRCARGGVAPRPPLHPHRRAPWRKESRSRPHRRPDTRPRKTRPQRPTAGKLNASAPLTAPRRTPGSFHRSLTTNFPFASQCAPLATLHDFRAGGSHVSVLSLTESSRSSPGHLSGIR